MINWVKITNWFRALPEWILIAVVGVLAGKWYLESEKGKARRDEKQKADVREAKAHAEVVSTAAQVKDEVQDRVNDANEAVRSLPEFRSAGELRAQRPDIASVILGDRGPER